MLNKGPTPITFTIMIFVVKLHKTVCIIYDQEVPDPFSEVNVIRCFKIPFMIVTLVKVRW